MCVDVTLENIIETSQSINIYKESVVTTYYSGDNNYNEILHHWKAMTATAHEMPAFGVSLDRETRNALKSGMWLEFDFERRCEYNEMPFEKLLVNINKGHQGFNLIRYTKKDGYSGRCYYYDLFTQDTSDFYEFLLDF